jgi:amidophosphoribosyltransferase
VPEWVWLSSTQNLVIGTLPDSVQLPKPPFRHFRKCFWWTKDIPEEKLEDLEYLKKHYPYAGELFVGHLRYGTYGGNSLENQHPFLRQNNWMARNLMLAGNYNITNTEELFQQLIQLGQQPKEKSDNVLMLEKIGHFIDEENQRLFGILEGTGIR